MFRDRLLSLRLTDESGTQSDSLDIQLDDRDAVIAWPAHGAELVVSLGDSRANLVAMGVYTVDEIEHTGPPQTLTILAKAANTRASLKAPKSRSWDGLTVGDLVRTIAAEHGLEPKISESLDAFALEHLDQTDESDLHLLTRIAREQGAVAKPVAGHLIFVPKGEARSATGQAIGILDCYPLRYSAINSLKRGVANILQSKPAGMIRIAPKNKASSSVMVSLFSLYVHMLIQLASV